MSTAVRTPVPLSRRLLAGAAVSITLAAGVATVVSLDGTEARPERLADERRADALPDPGAATVRRLGHLGDAEQLAAAFGAGSIGVRPPLKPGANTR